MNRLRIVRRAVDTAMTVLLICLMLYQLTGQLFHEYAGAALFLLFIVHHALNRYWLKTITKGNYSVLRIVITAVDLLLILDMIGLMVSGIMLSRYVFSFLNIRAGVSFARMLHMLCSYWGLILMSVHIGLHWNSIISLLKKAPVPVVYAARALAVLAAAFGVYAFARNEIGTYLFFMRQYAAMDPDRSILAAAAEYIAVMGLFIFIAHYGSVLIKGVRHGKK